jgi:hypothetical protein
LDEIGTATISQLNIAELCDYARDIMIGELKAIRNISTT